MNYGNDFSEYNEVIPAGYKASGKSFAVIRATFGTTGVDGHFSANVASARAQGLEYDLYHFAEWQDASAEAEHFVATARAAGCVGDPLCGALWEDVETPGPSDPYSWIATACQRVQDETTHFTGAYTSEGWIGSHPSGSGAAAARFALWLADWSGDAGTAIGPWSAEGWVMRQVTDNDGGLDGDIAADRTIFLRRVGTGTPQPPPPPAPAPVAPAPAPAAPPPQGYVYVVQSGDSLSAIAARFGVPGGWPTIAADNGIANPNVIFPGQRLLLRGVRGPGAAPTPPPQPAERTYVVRPGDTLSGIAAKENVAGGWPALYARNRATVGANPNFIPIGLVLVLP